MKNQANEILEAIIKLKEEQQAPLIKLAMVDGCVQLPSTPIYLPDCDQIINPLQLIIK